jgi:type II secretory pathway component GspD/PulD (secretin)
MRQSPVALVILAVVALLGHFLASAHIAPAQTKPAVVVAPGQLPPGVTVTPGGPGGPPGAIMPGGPAGGPGAVPGGVNPGGAPANPGGAKPGDAKPDEGVKTRPNTPPKPPNLEELKVRPGKDGKVSFNFRNQPWQGVLEWLAEVSGMSLDWQELPGDYLNLNTQHPFTVAETRDLVNSHLLARGYTLIVQGDVLSVVNIKKLNPAMTPRIEPEELAKRDAHEFVKVSFSLDWMVADAAVEELKPMLSPNGKLVAMKATNRIEAMDAVVNLREIWALLRAEQSPKQQEQLIREYPLVYVKASDVIEQIQTLLGIDSKTGRGGPMTPEQLMQQAQRMGMNPGMMQGGQPGQPGQPDQAGQAGAKHKTKGEVTLVATKRNTILASAPPDKMVIIAQAIKTIDVSNDRAPEFSSILNRTSAYRLSSFDPEQLSKMLDEIGTLDPATRLQVDKKNRTLVVFGPLADHMMITALIKKLDGSERSFEVIQLRRLDAEYVAGTIEFMMVGEKAKDKQQSRRRFFDFGSMNSPQQEEPTNRFRVDADIEHNRLLLWANPVEMTEVHTLLEKLGEVSETKAKNTSTVRVIDVPRGKDTDELLDRIRRRWPEMSPNPLNLPPPQKPASISPPRDPSQNRQEKPAPSASPVAPASPKTAAVAGSITMTSFPVEKTSEDSGHQPVMAWADAGAPAATGPAPSPEAKVPPKTQSPSEAKPPVNVKPAPDFRPKATPKNTPNATPAPITITRDADGRLILSSTDTEALNQLEDLIAQSMPATRDEFRLFKLRYAWASSVATLLKDIFKEDDKEQKRRMPWWWDEPQDQPEKERARLSKRRPLKILADSDTNSILVQNADAAQMTKIEQLIKYYDSPEPVDTQTVRKTETVQLKYTKAKVVAETVKEVFRDLLSANDKSLQGNQPQRRDRFFSLFDDNEDGEGQKMPKFKGALSVGVDELSNSVIISAQAHIFDPVSKMVRELDEAAKPTEETVTVVHVQSAASAAKIEEAVSRVMGQSGKNAKSGKNASSSQTPSDKPGNQAHGKNAGGSH